jgi:DNA mismatch repair protein MutL
VEKIAMVLASNLSRRRGEIMTTEEMQIVVEQLMSSDNPYTSPSGRKTFITFGKEEIFRRFQS